MFVEHVAQPGAAAATATHYKVENVYLKNCRRMFDPIFIQKPEFNLCEKSHYILLVILERADC